MQSSPNFKKRLVLVQYGSSVNFKYLTYCRNPHSKTKFLNTVQLFVEIKTFVCQPCQMAVAFLIYEKIHDYTKSVNQTSEDLTASASHVSNIRNAVTAPTIAESTPPNKAKLPKNIFTTTLTHPAYNIFLCAGSKFYSRVA